MTPGKVASGVGRRPLVGLAGTEIHGGGKVRQVLGGDGFTAADRLCGLAHWHTVELELRADGEGAPGKLVLALHRRADQIGLGLPLHNLAGGQVVQRDQHVVVGVDAEYFLRVAHDCGPGLVLLTAAHHSAK